MSSDFLVDEGDNLQRVEFKSSIHTTDAFDRAVGGCRPGGGAIFWLVFTLRQLIRSTSSDRKPGLMVQKRRVLDVTNGTAPGLQSLCG